jgi:hypothetical protein
MPRREKVESWRKNRIPAKSGTPEKGVGTMLMRLLLWIVDDFVIAFERRGRRR